MNEELKKNIKEYQEKMTKFLDSCTNCSKTQLISILEREMNENHYLRNEVGKLNNIINEIERLNNTINKIAKIIDSDEYFGDKYDCIVYLITKDESYLSQYTPEELINILNGVDEQ